MLIVPHLHIFKMAALKWTHKLSLSLIPCLKCTYLLMSSVIFTCFENLLLWFIRMITNIMLWNICMTFSGIILPKWIEFFVAFFYCLLECSIFKIFQSNKKQIKHWCLGINALIIYSLEKLHTLLICIIKMASKLYFKMIWP